MNEIVNKFLLAGYKFMPEMHLKQPGLVLVDHLQKIKKQFKNLKKQEIRVLFTKMSLIRLVFNMIWLMGILKILKEEHFLIKLWDIKYLILQKNPKYDQYQRRLASMVYKSFDKKSKFSGIANNEIKQNLQIAENYTNQLLKNLKKEQFIMDLKTMFGLLI